MMNTIVAFSYSGLAPEVASRLQDTARAIRSSQGRQIEEIVATGTALIGAKCMLLHGQFGTWLDAEFGWSVRTAQRFMTAAEAFGANTTGVSHLPAATVYRLAALPAPARDRVLSGDLKSDSAVVIAISQERLAAKRADQAPASNARNRARETRAARVLEKHRAALAEEEKEEREKARALLITLDSSDWDTVEALQQLQCNLVLAELRGLRSHVHLPREVGAK